MAFIEKAGVISLVDGLKASVEALPEADLGDQIAQLQAQVALQASQIAALEVQVSALGNKIVNAIAVLQG